MVHFSPRLTDAADLARRVHADQTIKGTTLPYLAHLFDVCAIALRHGADEDQAIAALLHDAVEDGGGEPMLHQIRTTFGDRVADIVLACSDSLEVDPTAKPDWWTRKIAYLDHLAEATIDTALVSGADKLANVRSLLVEYRRGGDEIFAKFRTGRAGTLWYYRRIAELLPSRLREASDHPTLDDLGRELATSVDALLAAIGPDTVAADWELALAEERRTRAGNTASGTIR